MSLNLIQKAEILRKSDSGVSGKRLAEDYHVAQSTISYIKKQRVEIFNAVASSSDGNTNKTLHKASYPELEDKLHKWFSEQRARNVPLDGNMIKAKATKIFNEMHPNDNSFKASDGWLRNFKRRKGIHVLSICGEKLGCDLEAIDPFVRKFRSKIEEMGLTNDQIYNADESALFYRKLPRKTHALANEKTAAGGKVKKDRVTIMLCSNAAGTHKLKPLLIGKYAKPRCFNNFNNPMDYVNSKNAWMTKHIFTNWFHESFVKEVSALILILLLL